MMHGWGMGGFGMGFPFLGLLPMVLLGAGLFIVVRKIVSDHRSGHENSAPRKDNNRRAATLTPPTVEVFRLAKRHGGVITVSDVVSELGIDPKEAEKLLDGVTDGLRVEMDVDSNGVMRYTFREFS